MSVVAGEFERRLSAALAWREAAVSTVSLEARCGECDGVGAVLDPGWADWHAREWDARVAFERAHGGGSGWLDSEEFAGLVAEAATLPDVEEVPCVECGGCGGVPTEAGRVLLGFLRRHLTL